MDRKSLQRKIDETRRKIRKERVKNQEIIGEIQKIKSQRSQSEFKGVKVFGTTQNSFYNRSSLPADWEG